MMSDTQFVTAVVYTLSWIEKMGIVLKPEQVKAMHHVYQGTDVTDQVWQVHLLQSPMLSHCCPRPYS